MSRSTRSKEVMLTKVFPLCAVAFLVLCLAACSSGPEKALLGTWKGPYFTVEFYPKGNFQVHGYGSGTYTFIDSSRIKLDWGGPGNAAIYKMTISADRMDLSGGSSLNGTYTRVK